MSETALLQHILIALNERFHPNGLWYRRNVGLARAGRGAVRFGLSGQADIAGMYRGRAVEIEVKTASGRQSPAQMNWQRAVERAGGVYVLARGVDEAVRAVEGINEIQAGVFIRNRTT